MNRRTFGKVQEGFKRLAKSLAAILWTSLMTKTGCHTGAERTVLGSAENSLQHETGNSRIQDEGGSQSPPGTPVLWLWVKRAILENDRVEDFSADEAAPPREGRHAGTDLQIHERLFHHQIVTAWASHHEVGVCRTPTHASPFEATARSLAHATGAARGSARGAAKLLP